MNVINQIKHRKLQKSDKPENKVNTIIFQEDPTKEPFPESVSNVILEPNAYEKDYNATIEGE